ncbi:MAG: DUF2268 domain-containing putative Zn-dependent protease [Bacteroidetes bacterium]|nr:DUF2268 domain-containing putative Zn-dependent protease [Bacteroidota bacterium]
MKSTIIFAFLFCSTMVLAQTKRDAAIENQKAIQTSDVDHFWSAYDQFKHCHSFQDSVNCIKSLYFEKGTGGFNAFINKYHYTAEDYIQSISQHPKFFNSIRGNTDEVNRIEDGINQFFNHLKEYYPDYKPLKICFVISPLQSGGTSTEGYLFIGTEIIASTKEADLTEFGTSVWAKVLAFDTNIRERLIFVVAHETIHDLQVNADFNNYDLLNKSLNEGSADFIAELFTGVNANHYLYDYGNLHEHDLWTLFKKAIENHENTDNWMYNADRVEEGVPADLGYYVGYRITESFYQKSSDKKQAILDIIQMKTPAEFLKNSGYEYQQ